MLKNIIIVLIILSQVLTTSGQEKDKLFFLESDITWRKELFQFPLGFAPDINYQGIEDARFPEGWEDSTSATFWSYAFAWQIDYTTELTEIELEDDLKKYFDGLMGCQNTMTLVLKKQASPTTSKFVGKVQTVDAFFTNKPMMLNVLIEKFSYDNKNKSVILFRFSPKEFVHDVWNKLDEVTLPANFCDQ